MFFKLKFWLNPLVLFGGDEDVYLCLFGGDDLVDLWVNINIEGHTKVTLRSSQGQSLVMERHYVT